MEQLEQGHSDGVLPAAQGFSKCFAGFLLYVGILDSFAASPEQRARRAIETFPFSTSCCDVLCSS